MYIMENNNSQTTLRYAVDNYLLWMYKKSYHLANHLEAEAMAAASAEQQTTQLSKQLGRFIAVMTAPRGASSVSLAYV